MAKSIGTFEKVFDGFLADSSFFSDQDAEISFTIVTAGTFDPVSGTRTGGSSTEHKANGFRRGVKEKEFTNIIAGDLTFTCKQADLGYRPRINDKATLLGTEYTVIDVNDLGFVAWAVQLRG